MDSLAPHLLATEPNTNDNAVMVENYDFKVDETFSDAGSFGEDLAYAKAIVVYEDDTEFIFQSCAIFVLFAILIGKKFKGMVGRRRRQRQSHLSQLKGPYRKPRRWKGNLAARWDAYLKLKGCIFLCMYTQTMAMDAQQASDLLGRIMEFSSAATTAARTASTMVGRVINQGLEMVPKSYVLQRRLTPMTL
eukprot:s1657_g18.t1